MTAEEAILRIRRAPGVDKETIYTCYVTENNRKLMGMVSVADPLLFSRGRGHDAEEHHGERT